MFVCGHSNVQMLTSPPILKLWDTQGYLWLPYDLTEVIKLFGVTFKQKNIFFFKKILYVIPSALVSFLPYYCHSFQIIVIPSVLLSFLPNIVIPSELFRELQILTSSKSFPYPKGEKNGHRRWPYMRVEINRSRLLEYFFSVCYWRFLEIQYVGTIKKPIETKNWK